MKKLTVNNGEVEYYGKIYPIYTYHSGYYGNMYNRGPYLKGNTSSQPRRYVSYYREKGKIDIVTLKDILPWPKDGDRYIVSKVNDQANRRLILWSQDRSTGEHKIEGYLYERESFLKDCLGIVVDTNTINTLENMEVINGKFFIDTSKKDVWSIDLGDQTIYFNFTKMNFHRTNVSIQTLSAVFENAVVEKVLYSKEYNEFSILYVLLNGVTYVRSSNARYSATFFPGTWMDETNYLINVANIL